MAQRVLMVLALSGMFLTSGCKSLFPSSSTKVNSRWATFAQVAGSFDKIHPYDTDANGLKKLGFDPTASPNVKILTYVEILPIFMPNSGVHKEDLPAAVQEFIDADGDGLAYVVDLDNVHSKRYGNLLLDIFGFNRKTHTSGWNFRGIILMKNNVVIYKLASGEPNISTDEKKTRPLGPLQELDGAFFGVVGKIK